MSLDKYDFIIIDSSAMFASISDELFHFLLTATNLFVPATFECEYKNVAKVVSARMLERHKRNLDIIGRLRPTICQDYGLVDTFGLANCLVNQRKSVLVVAANDSLEDRLILSDTSVDIYSLFENELIKRNSFHEEKPIREVITTKSPLAYHEVNAGDIVHTRNGRYVLGDSLDRGSESQIFHINQKDDLLAKVFIEDDDEEFVLTQEKLNNIEMLCQINAQWDIQWLALPIDVLYADFGCRCPIGYTMKKLQNGVFLDKISMFSVGDVNNKFPENKSKVVKDVLGICIRFVRQFLFLSLNGIHITDFNEKNFFISQNNNAPIMMIDTDSFCYNEYLSGYQTYLGSLSKVYHCDNKLSLIDFCSESVYAFVFSLLCLDPTFRPIRNSQFRYSPDRLDKIASEGIKLKWTLIPSNLQTLFDNVFRKKYPASVSVLLYELELALSDSFAEKKYIDLLASIIDSSKIDLTDEEEPAGEIPTSEEPEEIEVQPPTFTFKKIAIVIGLLALVLAIVFGIKAWNHLNATPVLEQGDTPEIITPNLTEQPEEDVTEPTPVEQPEDDITEPIPVEQPEDEISLKRFNAEDGYYLSETSSLDGYVEYYWDNGNQYKGQYVNGKRNGSGVYIWSTGKKYDGDFVDNKLTGKGTCYDVNGTVYEGSWLNDFRDGQGTLFDSYDCKIYEGSWKKGLFNGTGTYYFNYEGTNASNYSTEWKDGTCSNGEQVNLTFNSTGKPSAKGYWKKNVFYGQFFYGGTWHDVP